jgi:hypothetical protein
VDAPDQFPGDTHIAVCVASIPAASAALNANDIVITQEGSQLWPGGAHFCRLGVDVVGQKADCDAIRQILKSILIVTQWKNPP